MTRFLAFLRSVWWLVLAAFGVYWLSIVIYRVATAMGGQ